MPTIVQHNAIIVKHNSGATTVPAISISTSVVLQEEFAGRHLPEREGDVDAAHDGVDRGGGPGRGGELDLGGGRAVDRGGP